MATSRLAPPKGEGGPRLAGAQVLLVGTGSFAPGSDLAAIPAVETTLADLARVLIERCGVADDAVRVVTHPVSPMELGEAVAMAAEQADQVLLVYYVGHGLVSYDGALYLATQSTDRRQTHLKHTALAYGTVRDYLSESPARSLLVVLDCCFSGRAVASLGDSADEVVSLAEISGACVLTSAGHDELAMAPPGARHTSFSGELLRLLTEGDPYGPASLTIQSVYRSLSRSLPAQGLPRPRCRFTGRAGELVLARNLAYRPSAPEPDQFPPESSEQAPAACPYKGLAAFEPGDARWFFGREHLTMMLAGRLAERYDDAKPLVVVGASGAGKSSLLRAGLLPALGRGELAVSGSARWPYLLLTPTADPLGALAAKVGELAGVAAPVGSLTAEPGADPAWLLDSLRQALRARIGHDAAGSRVVLIIDQFEEIFTQCTDEVARQAAIRALRTAADGDGGEPSALVVLAFRADFYGQCATFAELVPALQDCQVVVGPMSTAELRTAIERPAAAAGLALQPGLAEILLRDLGADGTHEDGKAYEVYEPGRLPLLSHALLATWAQRQGHTLTVAGYQATGGIRQAIVATAEQAYASIDPAGQDTARRLLLRLVQLGDGTDDTRRRVSRSQLLAELPDPGRAAEILDVFSAGDTRLVTAGEDSIEITHDALLRAWPRLSEWIEENRAGLLIHQHLVEATHAWQHDEHDPAALYRGTRLAIAQDWADSDGHRQALGPVAQEFLAASIRRDAEEQRAARRRARRRYQLIAILTALLVLSLFGAVQWRTASQQRQIAAGRSLLWQAESLRDSQAGLTLPLGIAAMGVSPSSQARSSLITTLMGNHYVATLTGQHGFIDALAFRRDGRILATASWDDSVLLWDVSHRSHPVRLARITGHSGPSTISSVAFSPDGRILATGDWDNTASLWDVSDPGRPKELARLGGHNNYVYAVAFSPSGRTLVTASADRHALLFDVLDPKHPVQVGDIAVTTDTNTFMSTAFSPRGRPLLLLTSGNGTASLYDVSDPAMPQSLSVMNDNSGAIDGVAYGPDGTTVALANAAGTATLWDVRDPGHPRRLADLTGHLANVYQVAFSPDGHELVTASQDKTATLWDVTNPSRATMLATFTGHTARVLAVAFSPDGHTVATGSADVTAILWETAQRAVPVPVHELTGPSNVISSVAVNGRIVLAGSWDGTAALWDISNPRRPRRLAVLPSDGSGRPVLAAVLSRDGTMAVTEDQNGTLILWDITKRSAPARLATLPLGPVGDNVPQWTPTTPALSPDARTLVTVGPAGVSFWNLANPHRPVPVITLPGGLGTVFAAAFSPQGNILVTGSALGGALTWDVTDPAHPRQLGALPASPGAIRAFAFDRTGRTLLGTSTDAVTAVWDMQDPARPVQLAILRGHVLAVFAAAISPDGHIAVTGSYDATAVLWDITDRRHPRQLRVLYGRGWVDGIAFDPSGRLLLTADQMGTVTEWDIAALTRIVAHPVEQACAISGGLTPQEWPNYAPEVAYQNVCGRQAAALDNSG